MTSSPATIAAPPSASGRAGAVPPGQFVIAHRAGNDLGELRRAIATPGVAMVEADLRAFAGGVDLRHHKSVGPLPVLWDGGQVALRRGRSQLRLAELLDAASAAPATLHLLLDLKGFDLRLTRRLLDAIGEHPGLATRTACCARNWRLLHAVRDGDLPIATVRSVRHPRGLRALLAHAARGDVPDGVSIHAELLDAGVVRSLTAHGMRVLTWPVNDPEHAGQLCKWGVSGLISDNFEAIQALPR